MTVSSGLVTAHDRRQYACAAETNMIAHLGTFDVENFGDLLYPIIFRSLIARRDPHARITPYSFLPGPAPYHAEFETNSIATLFKNQSSETTTTEVSSVVIGGGDILRTDWDVVAAHYQRRVMASTPTANNRISSFMRNKLLRMDSQREHVKTFKTRYMNYPGVGPFLFPARAMIHAAPIAYMSCGVPHEFSSQDQPEIKRVMDAADFIYLRDAQSAEKLRRAGVYAELQVAPDLAVLVSDIFDRATYRDRGRELLKGLGVDIDRSLVCFQSQPYPGFDQNEIVQQLQSYCETHRSTVVLLPLGYCHGDGEFLSDLSTQSGGFLKYAGVDSVQDMVAVLAACDLFVGTSLHGNITASSFGIPHVIGPLPVHKADGFLDVMNLPSDLKLDSFGQMNAGMTRATELGPVFFAERAAEAKTKVYETVNALLDRLNVKNLNHD